MSRGVAARSPERPLWGPCGSAWALSLHLHGAASLHEEGDPVDNADAVLLYERDTARSSAMPGAPEGEKAP